MKTINSTQNKLIKERAKLSRKKERDKTNLFLIEGKHMIEEAYKAQCLVEIYILENELNPVQLEPYICSQEVLNKLSNQNSNAKIIGVCKKKEYINQENKKVIFLDSVQDPGNVGTIIRTAYSLGYDSIYLSKDCADVYNPKTIQSTQGALFHVQTRSVNLLEIIPEFQKKNMTIFATSLNEPYKNLQEITPPEKYGVVFGNEGQGIRQEILNICDLSIKIEMETFESLNVAIASGIVLYTLKHS